ncbi:MAG: hypothetical protein Q8P24_12150 [Desulfobacterales bacterium]|nr:hypothetical protein [Desulfobacterales bacterium]
MLIGDIIRRQRERLAKFKCPKTVVFLDELPKNSMGKVTKKQLTNMPGPGTTKDENIQ